jgi:hypothetical protein
MKVQRGLTGCSTAGGAPRRRRVAVAELTRVLTMYREQYRGFNRRHFHQIARREHGVTLSYSFVKQAAARRSHRRPGLVLPGLLFTDSTSVLSIACEVEMNVPDHTNADPEIELVEQGAEVTLLFDGRQAMQAWERDLMFASADLLCGYGSTFLEVGLGLGLSALRIAENPRVRRHVVVEKYKRVIDLFTERQPHRPSTLEIVEADFFDHIHRVEPASLDGIFFDPFLPAEMGQDEKLLREVTALIVTALKPGGVFIPFFTTRPELKWPFCEYFDRIIVQRHSFQAYPTTRYTHGTSGHAYIQCFIR